jgi:hypothetical protein
MSSLISLEMMFFINFAILISLLYFHADEVDGTSSPRHRLKILNQLVGICAGLESA